MAQLQSCKVQKALIRQYTPPPDLAQYVGQVKTPQRSAVFVLRALARKRDLTLTREEIRDITGVAPRIQSRILSSKQLRTRHNQPDAGPDPRGKPRSLKHSETAAIANYLDDEHIPLDDKGAPWVDIAEAAGVELPPSIHYRTIQRTCKKDERIINAVCEEEKELSRTQADNRLDFIDVQLPQRPHSKDWEDVAFCDEFHFGIGPQITKRIKRCKGSASRYKGCNVQRKKVTSKDTKAKAREEDSIKLFSIFAIIGFNYKKLVMYEVPNKVGK